MGLGSFFDKLSGADEDKRRRLEALEKIGTSWEGLDTTEFENLDLQGPEYAGDVEASLVAPSGKVSVSPIEAVKLQASLVGPSEMAGISTDPRLRDAQMNALASMEGIAEAGGMTATDDANMSRMINSVNQQDRGRREAIQQGMARRGMGGSGMDLLAQLQSSQGSTDRAAQQGLDIQGMAQARALEAMMQSGQLGGSIRGQDFGEAAAKAQAADAISRFNAGQSQAANQWTAGSLNNTNQFNSGMDLTAQTTNIGNANTVSATNAGITNSVNTGNRDARQSVNNTTAGYAADEQKHNKYTIPSANFGQDRDKLSGMTPGLTEVAGFYKDEAADDREALTTVATGAGKAWAAGK